MISGRGRLLAAAMLATVAARLPVERAKPWSPSSFNAPTEPPKKTAGPVQVGAIAGKPWKRGGRHTIKQRRALAFAARRR